MICADGGVWEEEEEDEFPTPPPHDEKIFVMNDDE